MSRAGGVSIGISADTSEAKSDVAAFLAEIQSKPVTIPITFANPNGNPNAPTTASAVASSASAASGGSTPLSFDTTGLKRQIDEVRAYAVQQFAGIPIGQTASSSSAAVAASTEARERNVPTQIQDAIEQAETASTARPQRYQQTFPPSLRTGAETIEEAPEIAELPTVIAAARQREQEAISAQSAAQSVAQAASDRVQDRDDRRTVPVISEREQDRNEARYQQNKDAADFEQYRIDRAQTESEDEGEIAPQPRGREQFGRIRRQVTGGFAIYEGLRLAQDYQNYATQSRLNAGNGPVQAQLANQYAQSFANIPIVGQAASLIADIPGLAPALRGLGLDVASPSENAQSQFDLTQGLVATQAATQRFAGQRASIAGSRAAARTASILSYRGSYRRALEKPSVDLENADEQRRVQEDDLQNQILSEQDPNKRLILQADLSQMRRNHARESNSGADTAFAERNEIFRTNQLRLTAQRRQTLELTAAAEGQLGTARGREFERGLQDQEAEADEYSPELGNITRSQNQLRRGAYREGLREQTRQVQASNRSIQFELNRQPVEAELNDQSENFRRQRLQIDFSNPREASQQLAALSQQNSLRVDQIRQRREDQTQSQLQPILAQNESLAIRNNPAADFATAQRQGDVFDIFAQSRNQIQAARRAGADPSIERGLRANGVGQLDAFRRQFLAGFRSEEIDPNRVALSGSGTIDPAAALGDLNRRRRDLQGGALTDLSDLGPDARGISAARPENNATDLSASPGDDAATATRQNTDATKDLTQAVTKVLPYLANIAQLNASGFNTAQ